jgi:hypothetical protein
VNNARDGPTLTAFLEREKALTPIQPPHLRYFDSRGRAELIRLILEEVGEKYEDTRFTWEQWLASEKPNTNRYAFAQAPQLTIDNQELVQSGAIIRYLARKYKLYAGDENNAQTQVDLVIGGFEDLRTRYNQLVYDKEFAAKRAEFETKVLPTWLPHFERLLLVGGLACFCLLAVAVLLVFHPSEAFAWLFVRSRVLRVHHRTAVVTVSSLSAANCRSPISRRSMCCPPFGSSPPTPSTDTRLSALSSNPSRSARTSTYVSG